MTYIDFWLVIFVFAGGFGTGAIWMANRARRRHTAFCDELLRRMS